MSSSQYKQKLTYHSSSSVFNPLTHARTHAPKMVPSLDANLMLYCFKISCKGLKLCLCHPRRDVGGSSNNMVCATLLLMPRLARMTCSHFVHVFLLTYTYTQSQSSSTTTSLLPTTTIEFPHKQTKTCTCRHTDL